jgi:hypothetical protein
MEPAKLFAVNILDALGIKAVEVPEGMTPTADLLVNKGSSEDVIKRRYESLDKGESFEQAELLARQNLINNVFHAARHQLLHTPDTADTFNVIWLHASGPDASVKTTQAFATFYGLVHVFPLDTNDQTVKPCFYFDYAASAAMPEVEAMILTNSRELQFCLNDFSMRKIEFKESKFYMHFDGKGGVVDPADSEARGFAIRCSFDIPRKNDLEVLKALTIQTGIKHQVLRFTSYSSSVGVR